VVARIVDLIRPTQREIEELAIRETQIAHQDAFTPICGGPIVVLLIMAWLGLAVFPISLWRLLQAAIRTDGD